MRRTPALALPVLFLMTLVAPAQDVTVKTKPGVMVKVDSKSVTEVKWINVHPDLQLIASKEGWAAACSTKAGDYKIAWYGCKDGKSTDPSYIVVSVADDATPDNSTLVKSLKDAYGLDTDVNKADLLKALTEVYRQAPTAADSDKLTDWQGLLNVMKAMAVAGGVSGKLPKTNTAIATYLQAQFPKDLKTPLTADGRKTAKSAFTAVYNALTQVAK